MGNSCGGITDYTEYAYEEPLYQGGFIWELMVGKRTVSRGAFYKDVIAGHISTAKISGNRIYDGIWHDGKSNYYLDGTTWRSGKIPVLEYDSETGKYREIW